MWFFDNPKSYPEMLKKIAWTMFFIVLIALFLFSNISRPFSKFMESISFNMKYQKDGINLYIAYLYIPFIFALLENILKMHDRISDLLGIRYRFDTKVIIFHSLLKLNIGDKFNKVSRINRNEIMSNIFYKYAGYAKPEIDPHLVYMALGTWCWYWIFLDTILVTFVIGIMLLIYNFSWQIVFAFSMIVVLLGCISFCIKHFQCTSYANKEVDAILNDKIRNTEVKKYLKLKLK